MLHFKAPSELYVVGNPYMQFPWDKIVLDVYRSRTNVLF